MRRALAVLLSLTLLTPACATAPPAGSRGSQPSGPAPDRAMLAAYLKRLPIGSRVNVRLVAGPAVHGTLMNTADEGIVVQPRTRIPEPPTAIPIEQIRAVEIDNGGSLGKAVGIGAAAGAGAAFGVFLLIVAIYSGD